MISASQFAQYLWCAHPILESVAVVVLWRRKLHKQFPVFFAYILAQIAIFAVIFPLQRRGNYEWYFWTYWLTAGFNAVLSFKVIHEVFLDVFRPYHTLKDLGTVLFKWASVVMLLVSVVVAFSGSSERDPLVHAVSTLQSSVRLVQFGLILFLILFSRYLGVSRRQHSFGIALGFGAFAAVELMLLALRSGGYVHRASFDLVNMIAYNSAIVVWIGYALARNPVRATVANHFQTQRWEQSLADIQHPVGSDSLIPMFESMVERAFSRSPDLGDVPQAEPPAKPSGSDRGPGIPAAAAAAGSRTPK